METTIIAMPLLIGLIALALAFDFLNGLQPAGRIGQVSEIADAVLYLANADFTTGVVLPVDGGMSVGKW